MSLPSVQKVQTYNDAIKIASDNEPDVAFLLYDNTLTGNTVQEELLSTLVLAQVFTQVARKQQALPSFVLLKPVASTNAEGEEQVPTIPGMTNLPDWVVSKIESCVDPVFWDKKEIASIPVVSLRGIQAVTHMIQF